MLFEISRQPEFSIPLSDHSVSAVWTIQGLEAIQYHISSIVDPGVYHHDRDTCRRLESTLHNWRRAPFSRAKLRWPWCLDMMIIIVRSLLRFPVADCSLRDQNALQTLRTLRELQSNKCERSAWFCRMYQALLGQPLHLKALG